MVNKKITIAICYDFDGTLSPYNMQEKSFIPDLQKTPKEFWNSVKKHAEEHDMDENLAYMFKMIKAARETDGFKFDNKSIAQHGKDIEFFEGVLEWFDRINSFAQSKNVKIEHYVISSGLTEMIKACSIGKKFTEIYASKYQYDVNGVAEWPSLSVNYTNKTQFLFRINKGIKNSWDNSSINKYTPPSERKIPFERMIYIGDGETDIPAMKMVKHQNGYAIAVYNEKLKGKKSKKLQTLELLEHDRADFALPADYKEGSPMDKVVKNLIEKIVLESKLKGLSS